MMDIFRLPLYGALGGALCLGGCGSVPVQAVSQAAQQTISNAQQDLQKALTFYGIAKGLAEIGATANPAIAPVVGTVLAITDPVVAKAQTVLNDAVVDVNAIEALVTQIQAQAVVLTNAGAPSVLVVPAPKAP